MPDSIDELKIKLIEAMATVESLKRELRNSREWRAKKKVTNPLEDLREKNLVNEELKERLDSYSGKIGMLLSALFKKSTSRAILIKTLSLIRVEPWARKY